MVQDPSWLGESYTIARGVSCNRTPSVHYRHHKVLDNASYIELLKFISNLHNEFICYLF
jgi:hypothetical protein